METQKVSVKDPILMKIENVSITMSLSKEDHRGWGWIMNINIGHNLKSFALKARQLSRIFYDN